MNDNLLENETDGMTFDNQDNSTRCPISHRTPKQDKIAI